ncbi:hypothetical protein ACFRQM_40060 [Streptomyces sp. NPDC056831]|uniref:hypothetical protein n=1 Tax=Streptomyces sp. NPDC056831 TaxID=3345954 RepID=UPI00369D6E0F
MRTLTMDEAIKLLSGIEPGTRVSLFDPRAVNHRNTWCAEFVLPGEQQNLPYNPICHDRSHVRIFMRGHEDVVGFISNVCACELVQGSKRLAVWEAPENALHSMSATGFEDRESGRTWQSTMCGVLLETTDGRSPWREGHMSYVIDGRLPDRLTCLGCRLRHGARPEECAGVLHLT